MAESRIHRGPHRPSYGIRRELDYSQGGHGLGQVSDELVGFDAGFQDKLDGITARMIERATHGHLSMAGDRLITSH